MLLRAIAGISLAFVVAAGVHATVSRDDIGPDAATSANTHALTAWVEDDLGEAIAELDGRIRTARAKCLADAGFHDYMQVMGQIPASYSRPILGVAPQEIGPNTIADAEAWGMAGIELSFSPGPAPVVIPTSQEFEDADARCVRRLRDDLKVSDQAVQLINELSRDLRSRLIPGLEPLLLGRMSCVQARGYPGLEPKDWAAGGAPSKLLADIGVEVGGEDVDQVRKWSNMDGFRMSDPGLPPSYRPTPEERRFAEVFVRCGADTGFEDRLEVLLVPLRSELAREYGLRLTELKEELDQHA